MKEVQLKQTDQLSKRYEDVRIALDAKYEKVFLFTIYYLLFSINAVCILQKRSGK